MMARLAVMAVLVIWLWATSAAPAHADPITTAVVSFFSLTGTAAAVASFVVRSAIYSFASWGMSRISRALSRGRDGAQERQATVTTLSLGETPREAVFGRAVTGGSLIDAFNFGGEHGTDTVVRVIALADHEITQLEGVFVDDAYQGFGFSGVQLGFNGKLDIEFVNASAAGGAPPVRFASAGGWTAADKLVGVAHVWVATTIDEETWTGHPAFRFLVKGAKLYNPAKDAALGYEGPNPHVWSDPATHEFTENAAVIEYNYRRGIYVTGRHGQPQHLLLGRGLTAEEAPAEAALPWIALCDELVGGQPRYRAAGVVTTADGHDAVAQWLADATAGQVVQREGGIEVEPGHAKAPVMTITDGDLVVGEKVVFNAFSPDGSSGRYNTIIPRYVEPTQGWQDHSGPVRRDLDDIADDGGPRELTLPLPMVTWGAQADRCAEIRRRRERLEKTATIVLPPRFAALEEGDWIAWQSDRRHGGETVTYQIEEVELGPNWRQYLVLREISAEVFDDGDGLDDDADPLTPTPQPDAVYLTGVEVHPHELVAGETAAVRPALRFVWNAPVDAAIVAIRAEVRVRGSADVASTTSDEVNAGALVVDQGVLSRAWLEARLVPLTRTTRAALSTPWFVVRVGQGVSDDLTAEGPGRRRILLDQLDEARARFDADLEAENEANANEVLTRDLVSVLGDVNPVQRRALLRTAELDLEGSSLNLLQVTSRTELGLDDFGDVNRPLRPDIITDSGLVDQLQLDDATTGLTGLIDSVSDDLELIEGDVTDLSGVVDGHTGDIGGLTTSLTLVGDNVTTLEGTVGGLVTDLTTLEGGVSDLTGVVDGIETDLVALDGVVDGITIGADGTMSGGRGAVTLPGLGAGDLAVLDAVDLDTNVIEGTVNRFFTATEEGRLAGIEDGATAGADFEVNVANVPANLLALVGTEVLDNSEITLDADGSLLGAGGGAVTLPGLGAGDLAVLDAVNLDDDVVDGTTYTRFSVLEQTKLDGIADGATDDTAVDLLEEGLTDGTVRPLTLAQGATVKLSASLATAVQAQSYTLQAGDGETVAFGTTYPFPPVVVPISLDNLLLGDATAGDYFLTDPVSITTTGFTGRARRKNPGAGGTSVLRTDDGEGNGTATPGADHIVAFRNKALSGVAANGQYDFAVTVVTKSPPSLNPRTMVVGVFGRKVSGGTWTQLGQKSIQSSSETTDSESSTLAIVGSSEWSDWNTITGTGNDGYEYKAEVISGYISGVMYLSNFQSVQYTEVTGASGAVDLTALPSGGKLTYLVIPQASGSIDAPP